MSKDEVTVSYAEVQRAQLVWEAYFELRDKQIWKFLEIPEGKSYYPNDNTYTLPATLAHKIKLMAGPYGAVMLRALIAKEKANE